MLDVGFCSLANKPQLAALRWRVLKTSAFCMPISFVHSPHTIYTQPEHESNLSNHVDRMPSTNTYTHARHEVTVGMPINKHKYVDMYVHVQAYVFIYVYRRIYAHM